MSVGSLLRSQIVSWLTSETRLKVRRRVHDILGSSGDHIVYYFHRVDDPYCQLMVQILPELLTRFKVKLQPMVVERLPANMYPDPARYEALSILDTVRLAHIYGLGFTGGATVPDRLAVGMAARYLTTLTNDSAKFLDAAQDLGAALWRHDLKYVRAHAGLADLGDEHLRQGEKLLAELGHYASATLVYRGEIYPGLDRLDHLEERLNAAGLGDGRTVYNKIKFNQAAWNKASTDDLTGEELELFFSLRSPYSYIAFIESVRASKKYGFKLNLRPVLPMVTRGLPVPTMKKRYIIGDAAREARRAGVAFGQMSDPLGEPVFRGLALGLAYEEQGSGEQFFKSWYEHTWSKGNNGLSDRGMSRIVKGAGLDPRVRPKADRQWQGIVEQNRREMLAAGCWGVPTFRVRDQIYWGQDRLALLLENIKLGRDAA